MTQGEGPLLVDTGSGLTIRYRGRNLYSPTSPVDSARKRASAVTLAPKTLVLVPSPLLFYGVEDLLDGLGEDIHLLCVEVDQALMRLSLDNAPATVLSDSRVSFIRTDSVDEVLQTLHRAGIHRFRRATELLVNGGSSVNRSLYSKMFRAVEHEIQSYWRNRMTLMHMSHLWIKNFFRNLGAVAAGRDAARMRTELPVVVAGAGESLEGAAPLLRETREHYFLLAVDTAVGCITEIGLRPDAVVVLDAQSANLNDLVGFHAEGTALIADVSAYPECLRRFPGERWFFFSQFAPLELFDRASSAGLLPAAVPPLGSVGIAALYCALGLTDGPVLFAGLDFAFRPGKSHARGAPAHVERLRTGSRLAPADSMDPAFDRPHLTVESKGGMQLWSDNTLLGYSSSLDILLEGRDRVFDIGEMGLRNSATRLTDPAALRTLLSSSAPTESTGAAAGHDLPAPAPRRERVSAAAAFLEEERRILEAGVETAMEAIERIEAGAAEAGASDGLRTAVKRLDYVYLHFPDWSDEPPLTEGFLKRFVEAAETRASWIDRALALLS